MKKNPLIVIVGLAVAAVAVVLGLTKDRWMGQQPATVAGQEQAAGSQPAATETAPATTTATETAPAAPATTTTTTTTAASGSSEQATAPAAPAQPAETAAAPAATAPEVVKPTFDTVRVEKTGEAVIAGRAAAGATVTVMLDGKPVGSTTANPDGAFVVVPDKTLPAGSGALTIEAKAAADTAAVKSEQSVAVIVAADQKTEPLVAVISPDAPTKVLQKPTASTQVAESTPAPAATPAATPVTFDAIDYDGAGNIVFIGKADKGAVVRLYVDNGVLADATAGQDGTWTYTATAAMAAGNHTLRVDAIDATGKVLSRVELPFVREEQSKVAQADQAQQQASGSTGEASTTAAGTAPAATAESGSGSAEGTATSAASGEAAPTAAGEAATAETPAQPKQGRVVIQPGNNLWRIAKVIYGTGAKFTVIYEANKDLIKNPDRIYPGQVFQTPDVVPPEQIDPHRRDPLKPGESGAAAP